MMIEVDSFWMVVFNLLIQLMKVNFGVGDVCCVLVMLNLLLLICDLMLVVKLIDVLKCIGCKVC